MSLRPLALVLALALAGCSKTDAVTASAAPVCDPLWASESQGETSLKQESGSLVLTGKGRLDPCFREGCTGSAGRFRISQNGVSGDFDASVVVDSLSGGDADLVFFVQSETNSDSAAARVGHEGGVFSVGADLLIGDSSRSLVDKTGAGSARLRVQRAGDEVTLSAEGKKGGRVTTKAKIEGPVRVGLGWSSFDSGEPVVARISELIAKGGVKSDSFDCAAFRSLP